MTHRQFARRADFALLTVIVAAGLLSLRSFWPTPLPVALGGTGASSFAANGYLVTEGTAAFNVVTCAAGSVLVGQGVSLDPACVPLSGDVSCTSGGVCAPPNLGAGAGTYNLPSSITTDTNGRVLTVVSGDVSIFGDGSMGAYTLDGTTGASTCMSKASSVYTLTCNVAATNVTMSSTATLVTSGYQLQVSGTLDLTAAGANAINWNGNNGGAGSAATTGGTGGATLTAATVGGSGSASVGGGAGAASSGSAGGQGPNASPQGGAGGGVGSAGANAGGAPGAAQAGTLQTFFGSATTNLLRGVTLVEGGGAGSGGGGGKGNGSIAGGGGGGSGSGAGVVWVAAYNIKINSGCTAPLFSAVGGTGGAGGTSATASCGAGGAGGGGGGGYIYLVYAALIGSGPCANDVNASGGFGGNGGGAATSGFAAAGAQGGSGGAITIIDLATNTSTQVAAGTAGTLGGASSGTTGGDGGVGSSSTASL